MLHSVHPLLLMIWSAHEKAAASFIIVQDEANYIFHQLQCFKKTGQVWNIINDFHHRHIVVVIISREKKKFFFQNKTQTQ